MNPKMSSAGYDVFVNLSSPTAADVLGRELRGRVLAGVQLVGQDLRQVDLVCANLTGADLSKAHLDGAVMHSARLRGANLLEAQLGQLAARDVDFEGANLSGAYLEGADLTGAVLLEADLRGADLRGADLRNADLRRADLSNANLDGVNLDGADLAGARFDGASLQNISARNSRLRNLPESTEALVSALQAAGASSRPPLTLGRGIALLALVTQSTFRSIPVLFNLIWAAAAPVRRAIAPITKPIRPIAGAAYRSMRTAAQQARHIPKGSITFAGRAAKWAGKRFTQEASRGREMAARVRREGQERLRQAALDRAEQTRLKAERAATARAERAAKAQAQLPGGPGADLRGQNLRGKRLSFAVWNEADLREARLDGATLDRADLRKTQIGGANLMGTRLRETDLRQADMTLSRLDGARMRGALLQGAIAREAVFIDADLRDVDLRGADLSMANLTGADLRGARLSGAQLKDANLTGARMPDVDLVDAILDGATLEQADLASVRWAGASVEGTDLSGALGLTSKEREALRLRGARVDDIHLERILGRVGARPVQLGMGVLALGMGAYLTARFVGSDVIDPAQLEVQAQNLRTTDPTAASSRYVELAGLARRVEDQVGYLIEAAALSETAGDFDEAEALLVEAMGAAESVPSIENETRLRLAMFFHTHQRWTDSLKNVELLVQEIDQPTEQRARAIVLYDKNREALGLTDTGPREAIFSAMGELPETQAALRLALSDLYTNDGDIPRALEEVEQAEALEIPDDLRLRVTESQARIYDRSGDLDRSIRTWGSVIKKAAPSSIAQQAAQLAIADLHLRQGRITIAQALLIQLLATGTDDRIQGRALLVKARIAEKQKRPDSAIQSYRAVLEIEGLDIETTEEARIAMASLMLSDKGSEQAQEMLSDLAPDAINEVMAHARLGEARRHLDDGEAVDAHRIYTSISNTEGLPSDVHRASLAGLGEALAQMGELRDALDIWRDLLRGQSSTHERIQLELLLANGLLQGGKRKEASTAFRSLADSEYPEASVQGLLGLAEVARSTDERARARSLYRQVADQQADTVWRVRALQEMADMAAEDQDSAAVITITRELLGALPPSHPAAPEVRLSLVAALLGIGDIEEAGQICTQAVSAAPNNSSARSAQVACAEVDERGENWASAIEKYNNVLQSDAPADVLTDAALGSARCAFALNTPDGVIQPINLVLNQTDAPALRLPLLAMKIRALRKLNDNATLQQAIAERDALAEEVPDIAWNAFIEAAGQSRTSGDSDTSIALLRRALDLPITSEQRATVLVELGHSHLDLGALLEAKARFEQVIELTDSDTPESFYAGMGLAEIDRRNEKPKEALAKLEELTPPDEQERRTWMAAKATVLSESGDPLAQDAWEALVAAADADVGTRYTALKGQADALLAQDKAAEAIPLFEEARRIAKESWQSGWAGIGLAGAMAEANDVESAITLLDELREHADPEVAMQAMLKRSQLASDNKDWEVALRVLKPKAAIKLGPAWDATATQARTRALSGAGDLDGANAAWRALANRWPDEEEAILPAWLGLAELAQSIGDDTEAHRWARRAFKEARDPGYRQRARSLVRSLADPE
ncbi:MAG: hypothetical protein CL930_05580 [Deltaproteobacteria bacterium]|nr:hypothetical protein [Deltaproteobacteria bacterium]